MAAPPKYFAMSTADPNPPRTDRLVRVQVCETVAEVNARGSMTAEAFEVFAADNGRCELLQGKVRMMNPAGFGHGYVVNEIAFLLTSHVRQHFLGEVVAAETGFILSRSPDTVRAADVAFVAKDRLPDQFRRTGGFGTVIPDLVVEVRSPSDRTAEIEDKTKSWIEAGVRCVVNVDPVKQHVTVDDSRGAFREFKDGDEIDFDEVVPGWKPVARSFFGEDRTAGS